VIERVNNISHSVISDVYIKRDVPVIVTDATDGWPARRLFSLEFLQKVDCTSWFTVSLLLVGCQSGNYIRLVKIVFVNVNVVLRFC